MHLTSICNCPKTPCFNNLRRLSTFSSPSLAKSIYSSRPTPTRKVFIIGTLRPSSLAVLDAFNSRNGREKLSLCLVSAIQRQRERMKNCVGSNSDA